LRGRRFAFPKDLRTIATVWWLSFIPDFDGVARAFNVIFGSDIAVRISDLAPLWLIFGLAPLLGLLLKLGSGHKVCRAMTPLIVVRAGPNLARI